MRSLHTSAAVLLAILAAACGSSSSPTSSVTSPSAGTATALKIIGAGNSRIVIGDTAQFTAMATMSNGAAMNVTNEAAWTTSDPSLFAVAAGGKAYPGPFCGS